MESTTRPTKADLLPEVPNDPDLYDAELTHVDTLRGGLVFSVNDRTYRVACPHVNSFSVGAIGRLRLPTDGREFAFNAYPDQRLRRAPSADQPRDRRWGWCIGERIFTVEAGVIPGRAGKVIRRDTQRISLEVPREFVDFCAMYRLTADDVLSTFFADLCALANSYVCPREDGYAGHGPDGHRLALDYFNRTWGLEGGEPPPSRRMGKRKSQSKPDETPGLPPNSLARPPISPR